MICIRGLLVVISAVIFLILDQTAQAAPDRIALVIGNGKYVNTNTLPNPPNDARAVGKALTAVGFDVLQGIDLDRVAMENLLRKFLNKAVGAKVSLLFYAGHGLQVDGRNYLIPVDAKIESASDLNFGTVDLENILRSLDDPSRANIIILDACRDNPMARSFASHSRSATVEAGLAPYTSLGTGTLIVFSTAPGKVAGDGQGTNSPFTSSLVKYLGTPGLEVRQMLTRVRAEVASTTGDKQVPWDNSSLRGDVYLAGLLPATSAQVPQLATAIASPTVPGADIVTKPTGSKSAAPSLQPPAADAAQAWAVTKDTTSAAVLQDFIRQFGKTPYGSMARARLKELQLPVPKLPDKVAVAAPTAVTAPPTPAAPSLSGIWQVKRCSVNGRCFGIEKITLNQTANGQLTGEWNPADTVFTYNVKGKIDGGRVTLTSENTMVDYNFHLVLRAASGPQSQMEGTCAKRHIVVDEEYTVVMTKM